MSGWAAIAFPAKPGQEKMVIGNSHNLGNRAAQPVIKCRACVVILGARNRGYDVCSRHSPEIQVLDQRG